MRTRRISDRPLLGLAAFEIEQRRREVGVRKVLGASIASIVTLFWRREAGVVVAANLLAWPVALWMTEEWLAGFAFRIELSVLPFLLAGLATGSLFLLVVGSQALRIGRINPAETLRSE